MPGKKRSVAEEKNKNEKLNKYKHEKVFNCFIFVTALYYWLLAAILSPNTLSYHKLPSFCTNSLTHLAEAQKVTSRKESGMVSYPSTL